MQSIMPVGHVSLREKGVDLNSRVGDDEPIEVWSPFVRREWI